MILVFSFSATMFSGIALLVVWDIAKRWTRLRSGEGILAKWTIDPARWEWFRHHSKEWDSREGVRPNDADLAQHPGADGIEVVVTRDGILIGSHFTPLEKDVRITVRADWMEFYQIIPKPRGEPLHTVIRLPLQPGEEHLASEIEHAYQRVYRAAASSRRPVIYVLLFCFVGLPLVTVVVSFIGQATGWLE
ncbi:MAG TPA: hypothetical protein VE869_01900 [Gemmatimonas sp.]|nr:hypothetical protein [Gemmatimonas sp.]